MASSLSPVEDEAFQENPSKDHVLQARGGRGATVERRWSRSRVQQQQEEEEEVVQEEHQKVTLEQPRTPPSAASIF